MIFGFFLQDKIYYTDRSANVEPPLHARNKSHVSVVNNPFNVLLDPNSKDLDENFGIHIHQGNRSVIFLSDGVFAWLRIKVILV